MWGACVTRTESTKTMDGRASFGKWRCPARLTQARKTNLRGEAAHAARWGGVRRTTGIGFLHSPSLQRALSKPPALGPGFDAWGHSRETRELAGAVGEGATPCTDGRPSENTPPWTGSHQSSLPNAAKGYPHLENLETCFLATRPATPLPGTLPNVFITSQLSPGLAKLALEPKHVIHL